MPKRSGARTKRFPLESPAGGNGQRLLLDARRVDIGRRKQGLIILVVREEVASHVS